MSASDPTPEMKAIEQWAEEKKTADWLVAVCKATVPGWGVGKMVDETTFDAAVVTAGQHLILPPG